jgi:hypothetical protein
MHCTQYKIRRCLSPFCMQVHLTWGVTSPPTHIVEQVISHISLLTRRGESNYSHLGYGVPSHLVESRLHIVETMCYTSVHSTMLSLGYVRQLRKEAPVPII